MSSVVVATRSYPMGRADHPGGTVVADRYPTPYRRDIVALFRALDACTPKLIRIASHSSLGHLQLLFDAKCAYSSVSIWGFSPPTQGVCTC